MAKSKIIASHISAQIPKKVEAATNFLKSRRSFLSQFEDFDDFVFRGESVDAKSSAAIEHHLVQARARLARILWKHEVYIGIDLIDRVLYDIIVDAKATDPLKRFLEVIVEHGLHRPGFILFPLHSFGVLGLGFFRFANREDQSYLAIPKAGLSIAAQANTLDNAKAYLSFVRRLFRIGQEIPHDAVEHLYRSRTLNWLTNNPVLALKVAAVSGSYYENQFVYTLKLKTSTALIMMLSVMVPRVAEHQKLIQGSSRRINNWQTLDIRHYLTFERRSAGSKEMNASCVPMHVNSLQLAHLSDLNVDIDPRVWSTQKQAGILRKLVAALKRVEAGCLQHLILSSSDKQAGRVYSKLLDSIEYFRRSFSASARKSEATIFLAIAFETLLTDHYAPNVTERILRRARICMKGIPGTRRYQRAVKSLFEMRGAIVHQGENPPRDFDLHEAARAYVVSLLKIASLLHRLPKAQNNGNPIGVLLKD